MPGSKSADEESLAAGSDSGNHVTHRRGRTLAVQRGFSKIFQEREYIHGGQRLRNEIIEARRDCLRFTSFSAEAGMGDQKWAVSAV